MPNLKVDNYSFVRFVGLNVSSGNKILGRPIKQKRVFPQVLYCVLLRETYCILDTRGILT